MPEPVRVLLAGCGGMGERHLAGYEALARNRVGDVVLAGLCDPDAERLARCAAGHRERTGGELPAFASLEDAVAARLGIDAVDIAVPTAAHHLLAPAAFELGLHVLIEKPLALTMRAARATVDAAERAGVVLAIAENFRRVPANRALRALIRSGDLGAPYLATATLVLPQAAVHPMGRGEWYRDRFTAGSLGAVEMGVHEADLLAYWLGPIERVTGRVRTLEPALVAHDGRPLEVTTDDTCFALFETEAGVPAQLALTMAGHGAALGTRVLVGSEGNVTSASWEAWQSGRISRDGGAEQPLADYVRRYVDELPEDERELLLPAGSYEPGGYEVDVTDPLRYGIATEIVDFARAIRDGRPPEVGAPEALAALAAALAIVESSPAERTVTVADVLAERVRDWQAPIDAHLGLNDPVES
jgi:predicted dehydrogenase